MKTGYLGKRIRIGEVWNASKRFPDWSWYFWLDNLAQNWDHSKQIMNEESETQFLKFVT